MCLRPDCRRAGGASLVELVVFIVVVGVGVAGVLSALNAAARGSPDPMLQKQALAIAESLLEEVQLQAFTYCDPDDPQALTATSNAVGPTGCSAAGTVEGIGAEGAENRYGAGGAYFDNVSDYSGYDSAGEGGLRDISNTLVGLPGYRATIAVAAADLGAISAASGEALLITVTVTGPGNTLVVLQGFRTRHAPNAVP